MKYLIFILAFLQFACTNNVNCKDDFLKKMEAIQLDVLYFDSLHVIPNSQFYYIRSLDSITNKGLPLADSTLRLTVWPNVSSLVIRQTSYQIDLGAYYKRLLTIKNENIHDTLFPYLHISSIKIDQVEPENGWQNFENTLFCNGNILSYFNKSYNQEGGADGVIIILKIEYLGRTLTNEFSTADSSTITNKVIELVKFLEQETKHIE